MRTWLKLIGSAKRPITGPPFNGVFQERDIGFRKANKPGIRAGDHLFIYAPGGSRRIFALAEVIADPALDPNFDPSQNGSCRWKLRVTYSINLHVSQSIFIDDITTGKRNLAKSVQQASHIELSPEEINLTHTKLQENASRLINAQILNQNVPTESLRRMAILVPIDDVDKLAVLRKHLATHEIVSWRCNGNRTAEYLAAIPGQINAYFFQNNQIVGKARLHQVRHCKDVHLDEQTIPSEFSWDKHPYTLVLLLSNVKATSGLHISSFRKWSSPPEHYERGIQGPFLLAVDIEQKLHDDETLFILEEFNGVSPDKVETTVCRFLRNTGYAKLVKDIHKHKCQICGISITLADGSLYSEAHHIRPLGHPHDGPDALSNLLCVCPNHHVALDYRARRIMMAELRTQPKHVIEEAHITYHNSLVKTPS